MKILGLKVDGFKKLTAIDMQFNPEKAVFIQGDNEQGKTSVLDSIEYLFRGNNAKAVNDKVLQHDKDKLQAELYTDKFSVKRIKTDKTDKIEVRDNESGILVNKPQAFLDAMINDLTFNPFPFLNKNGDQKKKFMLDFLKIDFTEIDAKLKALESDRLLKGRELTTYGEPKPVPKVEKIDISDLIAQKKVVAEKNKIIEAEHNVKVESYRNSVNKLDEAKRVLAGLEASVENKELQIKREQDSLSQDTIKIDNEIEALLAQIERLKAKKIEIKKQSEVNIATIKEQMSAELARIEKGRVVISEFKLPENPASPEYLGTDEIDRQIENASEINTKHSEYLAYLERAKHYNKLVEEYKQYDDDIKKLRDQKMSILETTNTGVDGLKIKEDGLFYNDIYSENWSDSQGIRIACQLCQAMQPELKTLFIDRGESFGKARMNELIKWAEGADIQLIITRVAEDIQPSANNVFYIEEGQLVTELSVSEPVKKAIVAESLENLF